jgi:hypothetical protein
VAGEWEEEEEEQGKRVSRKETKRQVRLVFPPFILNWACLHRLVWVWPDLCALREEQVSRGWVISHGRHRGKTRLPLTCMYQVRESAPRTHPCLTVSTSMQT